MNTQLHAIDFTIINDYNNNNNNNKHNNDNIFTFDTDSIEILLNDKNI